MKQLKLMSVFANLLLATIFSAVATPMLAGSFHADPHTVFLTTDALIFGSGFLLSNAGSLCMAIQTEVWAKDIADNIFPDNSYFMNSVDDSPFLEGNKVHLPEAGSVPGVTKNRTSLPATAAKRTDTEASYDVDSYTTDPIILQNTEEVEVSYAKRQSLLSGNIDTLKTRIADELAIKWAPTLATNFVRTSGSARAGYLTGQTGNRKAVAKDDFIEVNRIFNRMDISQDGRYALIDANMYADLLKIAEFVSYEKIGNAVLTKGAIGMLLGIQIYVRSSAIRYDNTGTPVIKAYGASVAAADNLACLFWHRNFVRRAQGTVDVFEKNKDPQFYGDVLSAEVRCGGKKARATEVGAISLIEAASA